MSLKWDRRFLQLAKEVSGWSKDPSTAVGAVAVRDRRILATGYNGFPRGVVDSGDRLKDRDLRLMLTAHAEANLLTHAAEAGVSLRGATVYVTFPPCAQCAGHLVNAGVSRVVTLVQPTPERWATSFSLAEVVFEEAGVEWLRIDLHAEEVVA